MNLHSDLQAVQTRRHFLANGSHLLGGAALASLLGQTFQQNALANGSIETHFPAKAKRVIYLHMVGGPSQMDLFDYKLEMAKWNTAPLPP